MLIRKFAIDLIILLILVSNCRIKSTRISLDYQDEPTSKQIFNSYRYELHNNLLYYLTAANVSYEDIAVYPKVFQDDIKQYGSVENVERIFNSSELFRRMAPMLWMVPALERPALQIYDDSKVQNLASGPQVDQQLCKLHLDYMIHMVSTHYNNLVNSTERSIFFIMNSFGSPRVGLSNGNVEFPGDYANCKETKLNVIKHELLEVTDEETVNRYFERQKRELEENRKKETSFEKIVKYMRFNFGPLIGLARDRNVNIPPEMYIDKMHPLPMRYCFANLRWPTWPNSTFYKRNLAFRTAACLPETCDSNSLDLYAGEIKYLVNFQMSKFHEGFYIDNLYCLPDEKSPLRDPFNFTDAKLFIIFNLLWLGLTVIVSFWHLIVIRSRVGQTKKDMATTRDPRLWDYLKSWSLIDNLRDCFKTRRNSTTSPEERKESGSKEPNLFKPIKGRVDLDRIDGIKTISAISIIYIHAFMITMGDNSKPTYTHSYTSSTILAIGAPLAASAVDAFFVITGLLTARSLFQLPKKTLTQPSFWLKYFIFRYMRIVPFYLLTHWLLKSYFRFVGEGPFWDYGTSDSSWSNMCQNESFWDVIVPRANFKSPTAHCNLVGWYLANDIQMSLLTPVFVLIYTKSPKLGYITTTLSCIGLTICHVLYYYIDLKDPESLFEWSLLWPVQISDDVSPGYVRPQYRCAPYLIGLTAGYILLKYECGHIKAWPNWFNFYGQVYCYYTLYMVISTPYVASMIPFDDPDYVRWTGAISQGTAHETTGIAFAIFLLIICTGRTSFCSRFLRLKVFKPVANAALSVVLMHIPWIYYKSLSSTIQSEPTVYNIASTMYVRISECILLALIVYVLYEAPLRRFLTKLLARAFLGTGSRNEKLNEKVKGKLKGS